MWHKKLATLHGERYSSGHRTSKEKQLLSEGEMDIGKGGGKKKHHCIAVSHQKQTEIV